MDSGHQTFDNLEVIMDDLGQRGEAVGGAGSIRDDLERGVVGVQVDTAHKHGGVGTGGRDDHLLGTSSQVSLSIKRQTNKLEKTQWKNNEQKSRQINELEKNKWKINKQKTPTRYFYLLF